MSRERIRIPTLKDQASTYRTLFQVFQKSKESTIELDFSNCNGISHIGIAFLVGCLVETRSDTNVFVVDWNTVKPDMRKKITKHFDWIIQKDSADAVELHEVPSRMFVRTDQVIPYLIENWLSPGWIKLSDDLKRALAGRTYEMFSNAFEHSNATTVFVCGEHQERQKKLKLAIVDFGIGIPGNVRPYVGPSMSREPSDVQCLRWAMQEGATTTNSEVPRGLGLGLLRQMVKINGGQLDMYSHSAHATVRGGELKVTKFDEFFPGTLVNIMFRCDDNYYRFASEES